MRPKTYITIAWIVVCLGVLGISFVGCSLPENRDNPIALTWAMLALGFPSSLLVAFFLALLPDVLPSSSCWGLLIMWSVFFVPGYFQWFRLVPFLANRLKNRKYSKQGSGVA